MTNPISRRRAWTADDDKQLDLLVLLGETPSAICKTMDRYTATIYKKMKERGHLPTGTSRGWERYEDAYLTSHYATTPMQDMAKELDRTIAAIYARASHLKLPRKPVKD